MAQNLYEALRESHALQRSMLRSLLRSKPGTAERISGFKALRVELEAHEAAEERFLYAPILMEDAGLDASRHALHEHHEIDGLVDEVRKLDPAGDAWLAKARELSKQVHHHLREEEKKFFQVSGRILDDAQKARLATKYRRDYARMKAKLSSG